MTQHKLINHFGGWVPQRPDHRDRIHTPASAVFPAAFQLNIDGIPVLNQGQQSSCTGHGSTGPVMFDQKQQGDPIVVPSRAMVYYDARLPEGTTGQDAGATVRDAVAGIARYGVCPDSEFPYDDQVYNVAPSVQNYADGRRQEALVYETVQFPHLNATIASGYPIVNGMTVFESFESEPVAQTGIVPIPSRDDRVIGGHCTWVYGYNATDQPWTAPDGVVYPPHTKRHRNSWGPQWGASGDFFLPQYFYTRGLVTDHWVIRRIG